MIFDQHNIFWTPFLHRTRTCCTIITWWEPLAKIWPFWWLKIIKIWQFHFLKKFHYHIHSTYINFEGLFSVSLSFPLEVLLLKYWLTQKAGKNRLACYGSTYLLTYYTVVPPPPVYILRERGGTSYDNGCERGLYKKNIWWLWPPVVRPNYSLSCKEGQVPTIINHSQECYIEH